MVPIYAVDRWGEELMEEDAILFEKFIFFCWLYDSWLSLFLSAQFGT